MLRGPLCLLVVALLPVVLGQITTVLVSLNPQFQNTQGGDTTQYRYCSGTQCVDDNLSECECSDQGVLVKCSCQPNCISGSVSCDSSGQGEAQARWGKPVVTRSGLGFSSGIAPDTAVALNTEFFLGKLTHFNFPVYDPATKTELVLRFTVKTPNGDIIAFNEPFTYGFNIFETPNYTPCAFESLPGNPCSDRINFDSGGLVFDRSFTVNQVNYTVQLQGFKESASSQSFSVENFISNEGAARHGYLFGRITFACPPVCLGGGEFVVREDNTCGCDCSALTCNAPKVFAPDCTCGCPDPNKCNNGNGGVLQDDCTCLCEPCSGVQVLNPNDCSCSCPFAYCGSGQISNPQDPTCPCSCVPPPNCAPNEIVGATCGCECPLTDASCAAQNALKIEDPDLDTCACICGPGVTCGQNFLLNAATCECDCNPNACPNGELIVANCTCGDCDENWAKDVDGYCTNCTLTACGELETLDVERCVCLCENLSCDVNQGQVPDLTPGVCGCRNCVAGECVCGNGIVEPGEQCDPPIGQPNPCCVQCKFTTNVCNDSNACTTGDRCDGAGNCEGNYKCPPSSSCANVTCLPTVGICVNTPRPDNAPCGIGNFCNNRCLGGQCVNQSVICPPDLDTTDCLQPTCNPANGVCGNSPAPDSTPCLDGDLCTVDDKCVAGVCRGEPQVCPAGSECEVAVCDQGICISFGLNEKTCELDNDKCTVDKCVNGICVVQSRQDCSLQEGPCKLGVCNAESGACEVRLLDDQVCSDGDVCTENDQCIEGECVGVLDVECGVPPPPGPDRTLPIVLFFTFAGTAALIGMVVGAALLVKKVRNSKLLDPDTWNPDAFNTVGNNILYKPAENVVDNRLYEGTS